MTGRKGFIEIDLSLGVIEVRAPRFNPKKVTYYERQRMADKSYKKLLQHEKRGWIKNLTTVYLKDKIRYEWEVA